MTQLVCLNGDREKNESRLLIEDCSMTLIKISFHNYLSAKVLPYPMILHKTRPTANISNQPVL